jgi:pyrroloquinoline quinone biosynthesis protein B
LLSLKLLGTAAGGGFPQWNCACALCNSSRKTPSAIPPRQHLQAVLSHGGSERFLINASPDLRSQIEHEPSLQPDPQHGKRNTPIAGIVLTSADLDQVLGLLLLREFQPMRVYATALVRETLEANSFMRMLHRVPNQLTWMEITPGQAFPLGEGITCTPIPFHASLPFYARDRKGGAGQASIGLVIESTGEQERHRLAYTPALPEISPTLLAAYNACDVILVDGTFWSDAELSQTHDGTPLARSIGHIPMSGADGTICLLKEVKRPKKVFIHINNTNPVLDPHSPERKAAEDAGWQIAADGWQWNS